MSEGNGNGNGFGNGRAAAAEDYTRTHPHSAEAERSVLGSVLRDNAALDEVSQHVAARDFYADANQTIFAAFEAMRNAGGAVDLVTLAEHLIAAGRFKDVGGAAYLMALWDAAPTAANAAHYARIVKERSVVRDLIRVSSETLADAYDRRGPGPELLAEAERRIFEIGEASATGTTVPASVAVDEVETRVLARRRESREPGAPAAGVLTGYRDLDKQLGGLQPSELILLGGRPSSGKTALASCISLNAALRGEPVLFVSLEQSRVEVVERMICSVAGVDSHRIRRYNLDPEEETRLADAAEVVRRAPLFIDDGSTQTVARVAANARRMKRRHGIRLVAVDYLGLIDAGLSGRENRTEQIGAISRGLKQLAKALAVPVLCLAQLNRQAEGRRGEVRPRLSDLRESGSQEQDADVVLLMWKPDEEGQRAEVIVAKQRNGPTGAVNLTFERQFTRFQNFAAGDAGDYG